MHEYTSAVPAGTPVYNDAVNNINRQLTGYASIYFVSTSTYASNNYL